MKTPLLLIALALTACSRASTTQDTVDTDVYRQAELAEYQISVRNGTPPDKAWAQLVAARELNRKLEHDPEAIWKEQQRQRELAALNTVTCQNQPYLARCN
jgi:hypothetical protein